MRQLSQRYLAALADGHLRPLLQAVRTDPDLDLEIREDYVNVYFKGASLLKLIETPSGFPFEIDVAYLDDVSLPERLDDIAAARCWVDQLPTLKRNVVANGSETGPKSIETEYEQMIIRANNRGPRNVNTEYIVVDRQYAGNEGRFDLTAVCWPRSGRQRNRVADLCLIEVKYGLNPDIKHVHKQLEAYHDAVTAHAQEYAGECETLLRQKLALGLIQGTAERLRALAELRVRSDPGRFQYILALVDYNPYSKSLNIKALRNLPFADQLRVFSTGFAMWECGMTPVDEYSPR